MAQSVAYFTGFETGHASEISALGASSSVVTTPVRTGGYALKQAATASVLYAPAAFSAQWVWRTYLQIPALPGANTIVLREIIGAATTRFCLRISTAGNYQLLDNGATLGLTTATGSAPATGVFTRLELIFDPAAGGVCQLYVNGVLDINTTHSSDVSGTNITGFRVSAVASPNEYFLDDIRIDTGGVTPIGAGQCIARQGIAGTPTYDAWTKNGAATAALCWSDTPFGTGTNCSDTGLNAFQTMLAGSFATDPGRAVEGTQVISAADKINAVKVGLVGKSSLTAAGAGAFSIRRRVGGADTDTAKTFTTSDAYYESAIFTDTVANLNAYEIGAGHGGVAATHTVEDVWMMVDYTVLEAGAFWQNIGQRLGQQTYSAGQLRGG